MNQCPYCQNSQPKQCRFRPVRMLFQIAILYMVLVFGGGTLVNTGNPVAVEVGKLLHTVTLVEPAIGWAHSSGHDGLAGGLRVLADGVRIG